MIGKPAILAALVALASPAAAQFEPNSAADGSDWNPGDGICEATAQGSRICTLRAAIQEWNAQGGVTRRTIQLREATFVIQKKGADEDDGVTGDLDTRGFLIIQGAGAGKTVIDGNDLDRIFDHGGFLLELRDLTLRGGTAPRSRGGGVRMQLGSTLRLARCQVTGNRADRGGGISVVDGHLELEDSTISGNYAVDGGGGIEVQGLSSDLKIVRSAITGNSTDGPGGGMSTAGDLLVVNSTISTNSAQTWGGGIITANGDTELHNVTITNNAASLGGGIWAAAGGPVTLYNTLIAGNRNDLAIASDCYGPLNSAGYNLFGSANCDWSGDGTGVQEGVDPLLGPLADNGGFTATHLLQEGSSAIDAGDPNGCLDPDGAELTEDQRGAPRPRNGDGEAGARCDIGAVEMVPEPYAAWAALICLVVLGALARRR